jgi:hypothetical protein
MKTAMLIAVMMQASGVTAPAAPARPHLFLDVHELGAGKVTPAAVAEAHRKDLAAQGKHGVHFRAYWLDEKRGRVYCLAEAPSAEAAMAVHREAHGLVASQVMEVTEDAAEWTPDRQLKLYLARHRFGPGKVTASDVAAAHKKDLAVQAKHRVRFLNYWFDASTGTVSCLVEAPSPDAAVAAHKEAHGLLPDAIDEVIEGR